MPREAWRAAAHGVTESDTTQRWNSNKMRETGVAGRRAGWRHRAELRAEGCCRSPQVASLGLRGLFVFFFFPLPVMLPSEIPKLPTDPLVRGFPGVWKLLLLHDSLPGTGLHA